MGHASNISRRTFFGTAAAFSVVSGVSAQPDHQGHGVQGHALQDRVWPGGAKAAVSLTYDDALNSQLDNAVPELTRLGMKATFFLTEANVHWRLADWQALARDGHEVANHTVSHPCALSGYSAKRLEQVEIDPMEGYIDSHFAGRRERTFAYPCGYLGVGHGGRHVRYARYRKILERDNVVAARTTAGGPNRPEDVVADPLYLHAFEPTYEGDTTTPALRYLSETVAQGGWAILVFHDVLPKWHTDGDASVATHNKILEHVAGLDVWCAPMGQVFDYVESRWHGRLEPVAGGR